MLGHPKMYIYTENVFVDFIPINRHAKFPMHINLKEARLYESNSNVHVLKST